MPPRVGEFAGADPVRQARRDPRGAGFAVGGDQLAHRRAERSLGEGFGIDAVERSQREGLAHIGQGRLSGGRIAALLERNLEGDRHKPHFSGL